MTGSGLSSKVAVSVHAGAQGERRQRDRTPLKDRPDCHKVGQPPPIVAQICTDNRPGNAPGFLLASLTSLFEMPLEAAEARRKKR